MANEPEEVIKHQMRETRASLAEKLETLEQQVVGTVHNATSAVSDTVESVRDAVQQTVDMARTSVQDTVDAVKEAFDLPRQVRAHPWLMLGGSVAVGYTGGCLLKRLEPTMHRGDTGSVSNGPGFGARPGSRRDGGNGPRREEAPRSTTSSAAGPGLLDELGQKFHGELHKLKGLALGTMFGVVRDIIAQSAPPQVSSQLAEIIDSATVKLGGQPIHGSVMNMFQQEAADESETTWQRRNRAAGSARDAGPGNRTRAAGTID